jgi:hypothetical protein
MRMLPWLGALLAAVGAASVAQAQYCPCPCPCPPPCTHIPVGPPPQNPDACGPGYYVAGCGGMIYGPNYCVTPPYLPFNGILPPPPWAPPPAAAAPPPAFPYHPYARSPRDFCMYEGPR